MNALPEVLLLYARDRVPSGRYRRIEDGDRMLCLPRRHQAQ